jgi:hypothetical protein
MSWIPLAEQKQSRYEETFGELDERALVRRGNVAYAAGLALAMAGDRPAAREWLTRAGARWRESFDAGAAPDAWGRPVGALKAALLAGDEPVVERYADWTLSLGAAHAPSPIGRYAAVLALLACDRAPDARPVAETLLDREDFPQDVASALAAIAAGDRGGLQQAVESVVRSFERREHHLEDVAAADTALVLVELARRHGLEPTLPASPVLPAAF